MAIKHEHARRWLDSLTLEELKKWVMKNSCLCDMAGECNGCLLANAEAENRRLRKDLDLDGVEELPPHEVGQWIALFDCPTAEVGLARHEGSKDDTWLTIRSNAKVFRYNLPLNELLAKAMELGYKPPTGTKYISLSINPRIEFEEGCLNGGPIEIAEGLVLAYETIIQTLRSGLDRMKTEALDNERRGK